MGRTPGARLSRPASDLTLFGSILALHIAAGSYAFALLGYAAAKRRWQGWLKAHIAGQGGSYIAMTTAVLVVNWETLTGTRGIYSPLPWALPTLVGSPIIAGVSYQVRIGKRPKR